ncbi:peptide chain release factor 1, partial [Rhodovulum adriaticum]|nr:peptide chain release factor 1 [Rhodovulum adriaticum]
MFEQLEKTKENFYKMEQDLASQELLADMDKWQKVNREYADMKPLVKAYETYKKHEDTIKENNEMLEMAEDQEMKDLLHNEIHESEAAMKKLEEEITFLLIPKDPNDYKNVFVEIRSGAGGDEAGLFAGELYRMYQMYASNQGFKIEEAELSEQGVGGIKEVIFLVKGDGAYSKFKYESGVHRVQR